MFTILESDAICSLKTETWKYFWGCLLLHPYTLRHSYTVVILPSEHSSNQFTLSSLVLKKKPKPLRARGGGCTLECVLVRRVCGGAQSASGAQQGPPGKAALGPEHCAIQPWGSGSTTGFLLPLSVSSLREIYLRPVLDPVGQIRAVSAPSTN